MSKRQRYRLARAILRMTGRRKGHFVPRFGEVLFAGPYWRCVFCMAENVAMNWAGVCETVASMVLGNPDSISARPSRPGGGR